MSTQYLRLLTSFLLLLLLFQEDIDIEKRIIQATSNDYSTNYRNEHITNNYVNNQTLPTENSHSQQSTCSGVDWLVGKYFALI